MKRTIKEHLYPLLLLAAAFLWGSTFVAQSIGSDHVGAFTFLAGRSLIAIVFLFPLNIVMDKERSSGLFFFRKEVLIAGLCCGIAVAFASAFQQFGVAYTTTAKAGFITSMYVVLVPVLSVFLGKRPTAGVWFCVAVSVVGMYLLCMKEGLYLSLGDGLVLISALFFTLHIMVCDHFVKKINGVMLSCMQFFFLAVFATVLMLVFEKPAAEDIKAAFPAMLYAGIFSSGLAYTFQIVGQKHVKPAVASLIMCTESVFSALSGWVVLGEGLTLRELAGCALMFAAVIISNFFK